MHPPDIQTGPPQSRIQCDLIYTVLLKSSVDIPPPRTSNIKHYLRPNQIDESPNNPFTSLIDVNIFGSYNTTCTWFLAKSNSGPHLGTDLFDAAITPAKRDDDRTTQFLSVPSPTPTTIAVLPIQTSAPPPFQNGTVHHQQPTCSLHR